MYLSENKRVAKNEQARKSAQHQWQCSFKRVKIALTFYLVPKKNTVDAPENGWICYVSLQNMRLQCVGVETEQTSARAACNGMFVASHVHNGTYCSANRHNWCA